MQEHPRQRQGGCDSLRSHSIRLLGYTETVHSTIKQHLLLPTPEMLKVCSPGTPASLNLLLDFLLMQTCHASAWLCMHCITAEVHFSRLLQAISVEQSSASV